MEYVTLPVTDFFEQVGILKTCTTSLKKTTEELGGIQRNLVESNRQVVQIAHRIENLSLQQKQAREKQDEQLASILAAQMESLKDQNLNSAQNAILLDNQRKQMAEKRLEDEKQRKLRQLILTFNSLKNALKEIKKEPDYFDRYVWLSNLNYCMSVNSLAPTELGTLSDIEFATSTIEEFGQEWSNSKNLLSENDRTDINSFTRIRQQLINDSPELEKERANIS
ncbi:MAG TPA: hypothetical protein VKI61_15160, partial [Chitinophagaceae bacterium]|nr:hypothetical protein [Chitinophagaceae bacterium]